MVLDPKVSYERGRLLKKQNEAYDLQVGGRMRFAAFTRSSDVVRVVLTRFMNCGNTAPPVRNAPSRIAEKLYVTDVTMWTE